MGGPIAVAGQRNIKTSALLSKRSAGRYELCKQAYRVGSGVRFGTDILSVSQPPLVQAFSETTRSRRAVIAGLVDFTSTLGVLAGGMTRLELQQMCWVGIPGSGSDSFDLKNPRVTSITGNPLLGVDLVNDDLDVWARVAGHGTWPGIVAQGEPMNIEQQSVGPLPDNSIPGAANPQPSGSAVVRQQLVALELPHVSIVLQGMSLSAAEVGQMDQDHVQYPKVRYLVEEEAGVPINWTCLYNNTVSVDAGFALEMVALHTASAADNYVPITGAGSPVGSTLHSQSNQMLEVLGWKYRIARDGTLRIGIRSVNAAGTFTLAQ